MIEPFDNWTLISPVFGCPVFGSLLYTSWEKKGFNHRAGEPSATLPLKLLALNALVISPLASNLVAICIFNPV
jgi:hypothetical protein